MRRYLIVPIILFVFVYACSKYENDNSTEDSIFRIASVGLKVTKPKLWRDTSPIVKKEMMEQTDKKQSKKTVSPNIVFAKYVEPFNDVNPNLRIKVLHLPGILREKSLREIVTIPITLMVNEHKDAKIITPPKKVAISGFGGFYTQIHYAADFGNGLQYPVCSETWFIQKGDYIISIGAGTRQDEKTGTKKEIKAIIDTIEIAK